MRVGLNGFFLNLPFTGSGQYLTHLVKELSAAGRHDLRVIPTTTAAGTSSNTKVARSDGQLESGHRRQVHRQGGLVSNLTSRLAAKAESRLPENLAKLLFEQISVPAYCRNARLDLLHVPYFGPSFVQTCPTVVTIHDLIMLAMPEHQISVLVRWYITLATQGAKRAAMIIADSVATKQDIQRFLGIPEERIRVIYLACGEKMQRVTDPTALAAVRRKYGLETHFAFYIGGLDRRKNVPALIQAAASLPTDWRLVIAGKLRDDNPDIFPDLPRIARESGVSERVRFIDLVPEEDKPALYSAAGLFVFPSLYEGFGLTPLEAMACGAPTLCSNATSLPEVVGDGGLLFDPQDIPQMARLIASVVENPTLREELGHRGMRRAATFSWRKTACETEHVYEEVHFAGR